MCWAFRCVVLVLFDEVELGTRIPTNAGVYRVLPCLLSYSSNEVRFLGQVIAFTHVNNKRSEGEERNAHGPVRSGPVRAGPAGPEESRQRERELSTGALHIEVSQAAR